MLDRLSETNTDKILVCNTRAGGAGGVLSKAVHQDMCPWEAGGGRGGLSIKCPIQLKSLLLDNLRL